MRSNLSRQVSAPSAALLRFLKFQSEQTSLSTTTRGGVRQNHSTSQRSLVCLRQGSRKSFSTSLHPQATVEASLLNLDFLRKGPKRNILEAVHPADLKRPGISFLTSYDRCGASRPESTDSRSFVKQLWQSKRRKTDWRPRESSPPTGFLDDGANLGRNKGKISNELKLRCTEFNEDGKVILVNGEFKKSELIAKYGLLPRDLRKIDSSLLPHILIRPSAILINLLHLRVLIKHNCVLVFDAYGSTDSYTQSLFMYDLEGKLSQKESSRQAGSLPYEFRALEAILISVTTGLEGEYEGVSEPVVGVLRELEEDIDRDKLRHLLIYSKKLGSFEQRARLVRDAIDDVLEQDDDLSSMYLTERSQGKIRDDDDHTEVEMLLESYHKVCDEIVQASGNLISNIRNTEEIVKAILDANRNSLMLLDLKFSIGTLGIGSGAFIAALYGMNLKNFLEESDWGFFGVSAWSFVFAAIVCSYGLTKLRKVQRVSMWGERGIKSRGSWRDLDPMPAVPGESRIERMRRLKEAKMEALKEGSRLGADGVGMQVSPSATREKR